MTGVTPGTDATKWMLLVEGAMSVPEAEAIVADLQAMIANVEDTSTATVAYAIGDYFIYDDKLYKATSPIASGATITPNTNCVVATLGNDVSDLKSAFEAVEKTIGQKKTSSDYAWTLKKNISATGEQTTDNGFALTGYISIGAGFCVVNTAGDKGYNDKNTSFLVNQYNGSTWLSRTGIKDGQAIKLDDNCTRIKIGYGYPAAESVTITQAMVDDYFAMVILEECETKANAEKIYGETNAAILSNNDLINDQHNLINYGYNTPYDLSANPSGTAEKIGIKRNLNTVVLNGTNDLGSDAVIRIRLDNTVDRATSVTDVKAWTNGITLSAGKKYMLRIKKLKGTITNENGESVNCAAMSVYRLGENSSVAEIVKNDEWREYVFTAEENIEYHFVLYLYNGYTFTNAEHLITLEDVTDTYADELYKRVDYLESDGTNYFSIGRKLRSDYRMTITFSFTETPQQGTVYYLFGGRYNSSTNAWGIGFTYSGNIYAGYGAYGSVSGVKPGLGVHTIDFNKNNLYLDSKLIKTWTEQTFETPAKGAIFATTGSSNSNLYYGKCRIYGYKLYDETGTLIHDRIPVVRKSDGATGFFNRVSGAFAESSAPLTVGPDYTDENHFSRLLEVESLAETNRREIEDIQNSLDGAEYVQTEAERVSKKVHEVQTGETLTFLACSDLHYAVAVGSNDGVTVENSKNALRDMTDGIKAIAEKTHIDFYTCFGDVIYQWQGHAADFDNGVTEMFSVTKLLSEAFKNNPQIRMVGNHDPNCENSQDKEFGAYMMNSFAGIFSEMLTKDEAFPYGGYGYHDFERQKVRFIVLNTSFYTPDTDLSQGATVYNIGAYQAYWLCTALDLSDKADADEWQIVIGSHVAMDDASHANICKFTSVLNAYLNGGTWTFSSPQLSYNFSGKNAAKLALYLNGHTHAYRFKNIRYLNASGDLQAYLPLANLYIPNALPGRESTSTDGETYSKTANSAESTSFQAITVDFVNKIVYAYHYGAGIDVVMHYEPTTETSLTTELTEPTWASVNDTIATVSDGTVTPVADGYSMIYAKSEADNCIEVWNYQSVV